jgi:hypothetical protein
LSLRPRPPHRSHLIAYVGRRVTTTFVITICYCVVRILRRHGINVCFLLHGAG